MDIDGRGGSEVALWMVMMDETPTPTHTHTHTHTPIIMLIIIFSCVAAVMRQMWKVD